MKLKSLKNVEIINQNNIKLIYGGHVMTVNSNRTDVVCKSHDSVSQDYGSACGDCVRNDF